MMNTILGRILFGIFAPLPRERPHYRRAVDDGTRDAIVDGERARLAAWTAARGLAERGIEVDDGCAGSSPRGVEITLALRGQVAEPLLITARRRSAHALDAMFDDIDLDGALRAIAITPENVTLGFYPLRSTDAYDAALRCVESLMRSKCTVPTPMPKTSVYR